MLCLVILNTVTYLKEGCTNTDTIFQSDAQELHGGRRWDGREGWGDSGEKDHFLSGLERGLLPEYSGKNTNTQ